MATRLAPQTEIAASVDLEHQPGAVLNGPAVFVRAVVGAVLEELVEQVAIGAVDFHAVEAGGLRVLGALTVGFHDAGDFAGFQGARRDEGALRAEQARRAPWQRWRWAQPAARRRDSSGSEMRPTCQSCRNIFPPAACTASVIIFQPCT